MMRVRVVRSFLYNGVRLRPGQEVSLSETYGRALLTDGTVEEIAGLPARKRYDNRMMQAGPGGACYSVRG